MTIYEIKTFKDIQDAVIRRAKLADNDEIRQGLKEKINTLYQHLGFKKSYRWSGESRPLKLRAKYATGTISVTNGSDIVTGSGSSWTESAHLFSKMKINNISTPFKIIRVASTTSVTLDSPYLGTSASGLGYTIYKDEYGMYPDLHEIRKLYIPGLNFYVDPVSPEEMDSFRYRSPFREAKPTKYTLHGLGVYTEKTWATFNIGTDFWEDDFFAIPRNQRLIVWPGIQTEDSAAMIRYTKIVPPMAADEDEPLIPYSTRAVLVYGVLKENFLQNRDVVIAREWRDSYKMLLSEMESQVEDVDDELIFKIDRRGNRPDNLAVWLDDDTR